MLFKDLQGLDGIDKLNECVPLVNSIFADKELMESIKDMSWVEAATPIYKKYSDEINKIMEILEEKPESAVEIINTTARIIMEIFKDKDIAAFFTLSCESMKSAISVMASTKEGQSKGSSDM